jgi:hypothetical protein
MRPRLVRSGSRLASDLIFWLWFAAWLSHCTFGCSSPPYGTAGHSASLNRNLRHAPDPWLREARKRFKDPFVFVVHGESLGGLWWIDADEDAVSANISAVGYVLHAAMPNRDVVLISCNAGAVRPKLPKRVWYCPTSEVWAVPGDDCRYHPFKRDWEWYAGSIWDFVEGED